MSSLAFGLARALAGVALGLVGASLVPVYFSPFGGCDATGWLALEPGCAHWPEALRGFLFVASIALLSPPRWLLPVLAVVVLLIVSLLGGLLYIQTGEHLVASRATAFQFGYPILAGGMLALALWGVVMRPSYKRRNYV